MIAQGSQFSLNEVEVVVARVDVSNVRSYRSSIASRNLQAAAGKCFPVIRLDFPLRDVDKYGSITPYSNPFFHSVEEEIRYGPACWLWDYLRRSGMRGFILPLSGGLDSCSTALLVYSMCVLVCQKLNEKGFVRRLLPCSYACC